MKLLKQMIRNVAAIGEMLESPAPGANLAREALIRLASRYYGVERAACSKRKSIFVDFAKVSF